MPVALITGITGQDGSYLADLLHGKGYEVHGIVRRSSSFNTKRIDHLYQDRHEENVRLRLHYGDLSDGSQIARLLRDIRPDEVYNLGAQSHVAVSFIQPEYTGDVDGLGVVRILEAIRDTGVDTRLYQAGTSEMFGDAPPPQSLDSPFRPRSPYAAAKVYAHWMVRNYREAYGIYGVNGILFNHEGERRGPTFVTRKITRAVAAIVAGNQQRLFLGNLDAMRDWGHAADYVRAMWLTLQQDEPDDYLVATGETHSVREFAARAFLHAGLDWAAFTSIDPEYYRPTEVEHLHGDPASTMEKLGWRPTVHFDELVRRMVEHDLAEHRMTLSSARERVAARFSVDQRAEPGTDPDLDPARGPQPPAS
jgi:GDPmannose 4,6-dehydratase